MSTRIFEASSRKAPHFDLFAVLSFCVWVWLLLLVSDVLESKMKQISEFPEAQNGPVDWGQIDGRPAWHRRSRPKGHFQVWLFNLRLYTLSHSTLG